MRSGNRCEDGEGEISTGYTAVEAAVGAVNGTVRRGMAQQLAVVSEALVGVSAAQKMVGEL